MSALQMTGATLVADWWIYLIQIAAVFMLGTAIHFGKKPD